MDKKRPGVMLYFEVRTCLEWLRRTEIGDLFCAILDYAEMGVVPDFKGRLAMAWSMIQPRLDRDAKAYEEKCEQRRIAAEARWRKKQEAAKSDCETQEKPPTETPMREHADACFRNAGDANYNLSSSSNPNLNFSSNLNSNLNLNSSISRQLRVREDGKTDFSTGFPQGFPHDLPPDTKPAGSGGETRGGGLVRVGL